MSVSACRWLAAAIALVAPLAVCPPAVPAAPSAVTVRATLSGVALPQRLANLGQLVHPGDPLLFVRPITGGAALAAVATTSGIVTQVFVSPGQRVHAGDAVAVVQAVRVP